MVGARAGECRFCQGDSTHGNRQNLKAHPAAAAQGLQGPAVKAVTNPGSCKECKRSYVDVLLNWVWIQQQVFGRSECFRSINFEI